MTGDKAESFEDFKRSFSYGSRTDLSFKFLKALDNEAAGEFFRQLLEEVGELFDDPSPDRLVDLVYEWQVRAYQPRVGAKRPYVYEDRPFQSLANSLQNTTLGLVTSSGHFVSSDSPPSAQPELTQDETISLIDEFLRKAPELSEIPKDVAADEIIVRHPGYDTRSVSRNPDVALPIGPLAEAELEGRIGRLSSPVYSFVGASSQGRLRKELDDWVARWRQIGIEALFLVPV